MLSGRFPRVTALVIGVLIGAPGRVEGAKAGAQTRAARNAVAIVFAGGDAGTVAALSKALHGSFQRLGVDATFETTPRMNARQVAEAPPSGSPLTVRVWLDLAAPRWVTLYLTQGETVFVRPLELDRGFDSVALDFVDVVVASSVEAALDGRQGGIPRAEFQRSLDAAAPSPALVPQPTSAAPPFAQENPVVPAAPPSPPSEQPALPSPPRVTPRPPGSSPGAPPPLAVEGPPAGDASPSLSAWGRLPLEPTPVNPVGWSVGTFYEGAMVGSSRATHGPGLSLDAQRGAARIALSVHGRLPYDGRGDGATVRVAAEGIRLSLAAVAFLRPTWAAIGSLAIGGDVTYVRTVADPGELTARPALWAFDPMVRPSIGVEHHRGRWRWGLMAGVDVDLAGGRYVIVDVPSSAQSGSQSVWAPWRLRPYAALLLGFTL